MNLNARGYGGLAFFKGRVSVELLFLLNLLDVSKNQPRELVRVHSVLLSFCVLFTWGKNVFKTV